MNTGLESRPSAVVDDLEPALGAHAFRAVPAEAGLAPLVATRLDGRLGGVERTLIGVVFRADFTDPAVGRDGPGRGIGRG